MLYVVVMGGRTEGAGEEREERSEDREGEWVSVAIGGGDG